MHKWLLFEMAKNPKPEEPKAVPAAKGIRRTGLPSWGGLGLALQEVPARGF